MGFAAHQDAEGNPVIADDDAFFSLLDVVIAEQGLIDEQLTSLQVNAESILFAGDAIITLTITGDTAVAGAFSGSIVRVGA